MEAVQKVRRYLAENGIDTEIVTFDDSTHTAEMAASALGTNVGNIVKSLLLLADGEPVLVLCPGDRKVDARKVMKEVGARKVKMADADTIKDLTGFSIGGVPPVALKRTFPTLIDRSFLDRDIVYAGAGSSNAMFRISSSELIRLTGGKVTDIEKSSGI